MIDMNSDKLLDNAGKIQMEKFIGGDTMSKDKNEVISSDTPGKVEKATKWVLVAGLVVEVADAIMKVIKASKE